MIEFLASSCFREGFDSRQEVLGRGFWPQKTRGTCQKPPPLASRADTVEPARQAGASRRRRSSSHTRAASVAATNGATKRLRVAQPKALWSAPAETAAAETEPKIRKSLAAWTAAFSAGR